MYWFPANSKAFFSSCMETLRLQSGNYTFLGLLTLSSKLSKIPTEKRLRSSLALSNQRKEDQRTDSLGWLPPAQDKSTLVLEWHQKKERRIFNCKMRVTLLIVHFGDNDSCAKLSYHFEMKTCEPEKCFNPEHIDDAFVALVELNSTRDISCLLRQHISHLWHVPLPPFSLENETLAETFPKFPSIVRVIDMSDRNPPITAR